MAGADQSRVDCPRTGHQVRNPEGPAGAEADDGAVRGALGGRCVLPLLRELRATNYQWRRPFLLDSALTERTFGLTPTPIDMALAAIPVANPITGVR